ncbi:hypothetical protein LXA47_01955 [Massilia sp. P8910]|uniref:hypothetical protein n=1 Tax=Massilia antarctica TaxID=2765360 RepID=UPI001E3358AB|nr:hypothetical protein [Massilia antarctica]MCE3602377.1 hypothetical protein [Massilia antarctica]
MSPAFPYKLGVLFVVLAAGSFFLFARRPGAVQNAGAVLGGAVVDAVDGAASGAVVTIGDKVGLPRTNMTECEKALAEGRTWDASFACPAGKFIGSFF